MAGRLEVGSPIPSEETLIWHGNPSLAYSFTKLGKSVLFLALWGSLASKRMMLLQIPELTGILSEIAQSLHRSTLEILDWATYPLYFFMVLNVLALARTTLRHLNTTYTLTSQRVTVRTGILNITTAQIELYRLKDYSIKQSLWARICGYAHVHLISSDRIMPRAFLWALPDGDRVTEVVRRFAQVARAESGSVTISE